MVGVAFLAVGDASQLASVYYRLVSASLDGVPRVKQVRLCPGVGYVVAEGSKTRTRLHLARGSFLHRINYTNKILEMCFLRRGGKSVKWTNNGDEQIKQEQWFSS